MSRKTRDSGVSRLTIAKECSIVASGRRADHPGSPARGKSHISAPWPCRRRVEAHDDRPADPTSPRLCCRTGYPATSGGSPLCAVSRAGIGEGQPLLLRREDLVSRSRFEASCLDRLGGQRGGSSTMGPRVVRSALRTGDLESCLPNPEPLGSSSVSC